MPESENQVELGEGKTGYKHSIATKYYSTEIVFYPLRESLANLHEDIKAAVEGLILHFDATDRTFLNHLETYADFLEERDIEVGLLVCDHIFDEAADGITYREAKAHSKVLDLIELSPESDDPGGYPEVHRALHNTIWSNIQMNDEKPNGDDAEVAAAGKKEPLTEQEIEEKLVDFENLLTQAMTFRANTADIGRNERLLYAQQFADAFESIFGAEDEDDVTTAAEN